MNKCYLDTNVLIYFTDESSEFHQITKALIKKIFIERFMPCISPLVLDEFVYIIYRELKGDLKYEALKKSLDRIVEFNEITIINPLTDIKSHYSLLDYMKGLNLKPRDAYHLLTMKQNNIGYLLTFDNDFEKVFASGLIKKFEA